MSLLKMKKKGRLAQIRAKFSLRVAKPRSANNARTSTTEGVRVPYHVRVEVDGDYSDHFLRLRPKGGDNR